MKELLFTCNNGGYSEKVNICVFQIEGAGKYSGTY